jgi:hypothetical protein
MIARELSKFQGLFASLKKNLPQDSAYPRRIRACSILLSCFLPALSGSNSLTTQHHGTEYLPRIWMSPSRKWGEIFPAFDEEQLRKLENAAQNGLTVCLNAPVREITERGGSQCLYRKR